MNSRLSRLIVRLLMPWYDADAAEAEWEAAKEREKRTEAIRVRAIAARQNAERIRADYAEAAKRFQR